MFKIDDNLLIDQKTCPVCFGESEIIDKVKTINKESDELVALRECRVCKHWWIDPLPAQAQLSLWYSQGSGYVVQPPGYKGTSPDDISAEKVFAELSERFGSPNFNYLEIGCGTGNLLKCFAKRARIAYGVEPGNWRVDSDLKVVNDVNSLPSDIKFDIIVLGDVLEHLANPISMMESVSRVANQNAVILMNFPNKDCLKAKLMKGKWGMVLPFGHLNFFSSKSIDKICQKCGLKIVLKQSARAGDVTNLDLIKRFDWSAPGKLFRLAKSLLLGQIILGKDQWKIILTK